MIRFPQDGPVDTPRKYPDDPGDQRYPFHKHKSDKFEEELGELISSFFFD
jgi:hypothetical protein